MHIVKTRQYHTTLKVDAFRAVLDERSRTLAITHIEKHAIRIGQCLGLIGVHGIERTALRDDVCGEGGQGRQGEGRSLETRIVDRGM